MSKGHKAAYNQFLELLVGRILAEGMEHDPNFLGFNRAGHIGVERKEDLPRLLQLLLRDLALRLVVGNGPLCLATVAATSGLRAQLRGLQPSLARAASPLARAALGRHARR